jgi:hypothetical protein
MADLLFEIYGFAGWHFWRIRLTSDLASMVSSSNSPAASKPVAQLYYELLTLGDELLLGLTANGHLTFVGAQLGRRGVTLRRNITITDEADAIVAQFRESWSRADVVITTGGLGPTCDDRTRECIAEVLGQKLVRNAEVEASIEARFERLGRKMTPNNLKQAQVFERGEVLINANGTARTAERVAADVHRASRATAGGAGLADGARGLCADPHFGRG